MDAMTTSDPITALPSVTPGQSPIAAAMRRQSFFAAAVKEFGDLFAGTMTSHLNQTVSVVQEMARAGTVKDAFAIHASYLRTSTRIAVATASDVMQMSSRLARDAMALAKPQAGGPGGKNA